MKKKLIFLSVLVIALSIFTGAIEAKALKILSKDELRTLKGMNLITDFKFKNMFIEFMYEDSKPDFKKIYPFLSKSYLKRLFPSVKNVQDYLKEMSGAERGESEYREIQHFKEINKARYMVDFSAKTMSEGSLIKVIQRYFFILESDNWKFDGLDVNFLKNEPIK